MNIKYILTFILGASIGGGAGYLIANEVFKKKVNDLEDHYCQNKDFSKESVVISKDSVKNDDLSSEKSLKKREKLVEDLKNRERTSYEKIYKDKNDEKMAENEHPVDSDEDEITEEELESERISEDHLQNLMKDPEIIPEEDVGSIPAYISQETLYYYTKSLVLADENDEELLDYKRFVGDCLDTEEFEDESCSGVFVRNYSLDTLYEVVKINGEYIPD